jgi:hypothetical protein
MRHHEKTLGFYALEHRLQLYASGVQPMKSLALVFASMLATTPAFAEESTEIQQTRVTSTNTNTSSSTSQAPGQAAPGTVVRRTEIREAEVSESSFQSEALGIKLQLGATDVADIGARGAIGLTFDINFLSRLQASEEGKPYFGLSLGAIYSHLGFPSSDFLGLNGPGGTDQGTHLLELPLNLKVGYTIGDIFRPSIHGGLNAVYLSSSQSFTAVTVSADRWDLSPNLGADLEFGIGKNVALMLRPDWTFLDEDTLFTGTLGLSFPIS